MSDRRRISPAQRGLGDMELAEFRDAAQDVAERVASYLERLESFPVLPDLEPGSIRRELPAEPPRSPEPLEAVFDDFARWIEPNITHWQHPGFLAYFPSMASGPGILGEWLATGLNSNVMMWRNAPASTELEEVVVGWLRRMLGLPDGFDGMFTDTASVSSLLSLVAARHAVPGLDVLEHGLAGRPDVGALRMYLSQEAHSSIEKAAVVIGVGRDGVRRIPTDAEYRLCPDRLRAAIEKDRRAGHVPFCVVGTLGTTSSTSVDPADAIADLCEEYRLWFHVDAAYAGAAAVIPEYRGHFRGWERADSIVFNPHKWLFTPFDASLLLFRDPECFRGAFGLVPEYLRTPRADTVHDYHEYGIQLGRRFRALKLWFLIRYFGVDGIAARLREHCRLAARFAAWVDAESDWERLAPVPFSTVCFRHVPAALAELREQPEAACEIDRRNQEILERLNRGGSSFLSHTRLGGRFTLRLAVGNLRTTENHIRRCWQHLREAAH